MAMRLSKTFGTTPDIWIRMQAARDIAQAKGREDQINAEHLSRNRPRREPDRSNTPEQRDDPVPPPRHPASSVGTGVSLRWPREYDARASKPSFRPAGRRYIL